MVTPAVVGYSYPKDDREGQDQTKAHTSEASAAHVDDSSSYKISEHD